MKKMEDKKEMLELKISRLLELNPKEIKDIKIRRSVAAAQTYLRIAIRELKDAPVKATEVEPGSIAPAAPMNIRELMDPELIDKIERERPKAPEGEIAVECARPKENKKSKKGAKK